MKIIRNLCIVFCIWLNIIIIGCKKENSDYRLKILTSFLPLKIFTINVVEGVPGIQVDLLIPSTFGCPHDYYLTPNDMIKISRCDVLVINGMGLEEFSLSAVKQANPDIHIINSSERVQSILGITEDSSRGNPPNPHIFSHPGLAAKQVDQIAKGLSEIDPGFGSIYQTNAEKYGRKLDSLFCAFSEVAGAVQNRKIVTIHQIFDYLAKDLGLEIVAVIEQEPGQEPSAGQILKLIEKIKGSSPAAIFLEPQYPEKCAKTISEETGIPIYILDPVANGPKSASKDYYEKVMKNNLNTLQQALNPASR